MANTTVRSVEPNESMGSGVSFTSALIGILLLLTILVASAAGIGWYSLSNAGKQLEQVIDDRLRPLANLRDLAESYTLVLPRYLDEDGDGDGRPLADARAGLEKTRAIGRAAWAGIMRESRSPAEIALMDRVDSALDQIDTASDAYILALEKKDFERAQSETGKAFAGITDLQAALYEFNALEASIAANANRQSARDLTRMNVAGLIVVLIGFSAMGAGIALVLIRVARPIRTLTETVTQLASGDYSLEVPYTGRPDEVGRMARAIRVFRENGIRIRQLETMARARAKLEAEDRERYRQQEIDAARQVAANRAKTEFLANMSHELRTPLNAIANYTVLLKEEIEETGRRDLLQDLESIETANRHLLSIISNVLDLTKIEAGRMDIEVADVDLPLLKREISEIVRPLAEKNGNKFNLTVEGETSNVRTDVVKLRQCLLNLLANSCKFTTKGTVSLAVHYGPRTVTFVVADSGIGMSPEEVARIFDPFQQANDQTARRFGGTGLGLSITKAYTELLHGSLSVNSIPGEGTTFTMVLPLIPPQEIAKLAANRTDRREAPGS